MKELYSRLQTLGFSQYESRAYVALLRTPHVTRYELARQSGIPPSKIYEVMEKLLQKDVVVVVEEGGFARYVPLSPREIMSRFRRSYGEALDFVETELGRVYVSEDLGAAYVWGLATRSDIFAKATEMLEGAANEVLLAVWPQELSSVEAAMRDAARRSVAVAVSLYGEQDLDIGVVYHHATDPRVLRDQGSRRLVLVTDSTAALIAYFPEVGEATAHWSTNAGFVQMAKDYVRHDIWVTRVVSRFEPMVTAVYGADRERLRNVFAPEPDAEPGGPMPSIERHAASDGGPRLGAVGNVVQ